MPGSLVQRLLSLRASTARSPEGARVLSCACPLALSLDEGEASASLFACGEVGAFEGARALWDARGSDEQRIFIGLGEVIVFEATGPARFARAKQQAASFFSSVSSEDDERLGGLVALGGASFFDAPPAGAWRSFGALRFVVPRWLLTVREGQASLRLTAPVDADASQLVREAALIEQALSSALGVRATAPVEASPIEAAPFEALVRAALETMVAEGLDKIVVSGRAHVSARGELDVSAALARLASEPAVARFAFTRGGSCFLGATPERLVHASEGRVSVDALAGSISRGQGEAEDRAQAEALLGSEKDLYEHRVVVEAICASLAPLCAQIERGERPVLRTLRRIHHLFTPIRASLLSDAHVLDLVGALHPTPAVGGLPRREALSFLARAEGSERGWYAAPVGWFDGRGDGSFAVAIRSALVSGSEAIVYAGAGIVRGSEPASELAEVRHKSAMMIEALGGKR